MGEQQGMHGTRTGRRLEWIDYSYKQTTNVNTGKRISQADAKTREQDAFHI